jgi:hypothetical protein
VNFAAYARTSAVDQRRSRDGAIDRLEREHRSESNRRVLTEFAVADTSGNVPVLVRRNSAVGSSLTVAFPQHFARSPIDGAVEHLIYLTELSN